MPTIPTSPTEIHADDLSPGLVLELGTHTVTEAEIIAFATLWDPQFFHIDPMRAQTESRFGGLIASGLHTLSIYQRLWVQGRREPWNVIAGATMDGVAFLRPVRPGDVLTGRSVIEDVRLEPERHRGLVTFAGQLANQNDKPVVRLTVSAYLGTRSL